MIRGAGLVRTYEWRHPSTLAEAAEAVASQFRGTHVVVIGDIMVDEFMTGKVDRLSPEAPIPVMHDCSRVRVPGGAANVAMNLTALGAQVDLGGLIGNDDAGHWLRGFLLSQGVNIDGMHVDGERPTTLKTRYRTDQQQILRVDTESTRPVSATVAERTLAWIAACAGRCAHAVFSDYRKGLLSSAGFAEAATMVFSASGVEVGVDTKTRLPEAFRGATYFKPNQRELEDAVGGSAADPSIEAQAETYLSRTSAEAVVVTRGEHGMYLLQRGLAGLNVPTAPTQVFDVTGAGDTVMATIAMARASGLPFPQAAALGNIAAGIVVRKSGTAFASLSELLDELARLASTEVEIV